MRKKTFIIIIFLMSIALVGIIGVQILWLRNAVNIKETQFEQNVFASLKNIIPKLRTQSIVIKLNAELLKFDENLEGMVSTSDNNERRITVFALNKNDSIETNEICDLEKIFEKLQIEIETNKNPLERLNLKLLDTIIINELLNTGINLKHEFAVVYKEDEIKYKSKNFDSSAITSKFKANLFFNDLTEKDYFLLLDFPHSSKYIYKSVLSLLILSVLFTLIILATFIITVNVILKQKKLSEIKTDFINNITHELKTPIATLKVAITTLKQDKSVSENKTVELIERQGNRLQKITERVIDNSFNNTPNIKTQKINANDYINTLINDFRQSINNESVTVDFKSQASDNLFIEIDETYFTPAIINILDNAIKYNDKSEKNVLVNLFGKNNFLILEIQDNGTGIPDKDKKMIFEKFYRGLKGNLHNVKGLGIGLFFTKQIIELHKGTVNFESKVGEGTKFIVKLPIR